ncbi:MAG: Anti-sigma F factor antagonist [Firmicutes bacterium]|nr:Anti-sigma F factor antagonist [candidate division NPL-UPA2 bacterium]
MGFSTRYRGNILVVSLSGELDHHTADELRQTVEKELDKDIARHILLDLSQLVFMDSSGVGVLLGRYRRILAQGGKMAAYSLHPHLEHLYEVAALSKVIPAFASENLAVNELKKDEGLRR